MYFYVDSVFIIWKKILAYLKEKRKSNFIWLITENEYPFMNIFFWLNDYKIYVK